MARELKVYLRQLNRMGEAVMVDDAKRSDSYASLQAHISSLYV
jgi:hypothetical protein